MRTTGAPRCFLALACTFLVIQPCKAAAISHVTVTGGENVTCGDVPTLMSSIGATAPHSVPSRIGVAPTATMSSPLRSETQDFCASAISASDQRSGAFFASAIGRIFGQADIRAVCGATGAAVTAGTAVPCVAGAGPTCVPPTCAGLTWPFPGCCAEAPTLSVSATPSASVVRQTASLMRQIDCVKPSPMTSPVDHQVR